ncbi:MAG: hypothetical protein M0Q37_01775, partial [Sphaerochaeta sp.]|nr:hypothetical protein [Sphaerochaeta sp.]
IQMQADYKTWEGGTYSRGTFNFFIVSVAYPNGRGGTPVIDTPYGDKWPMLGANTGITVNTSPFYVDLYLLNGNPGVTYNPAAVVTEHPLASLIRFESPITFVDPFNPFFTIGVGSSSSNGVYNYATGAGGSLSNPNNGSYVPIDGVSGANSTPLVDTGGFTGSEGNDDGFWYGEDIPLPLNFLFSFLDNTVSFTLSEAYGNSRKTINSARMEVQNGQNGTTYAQNLTFTDSTNAASFQLSPTTGDGLPIDFKLFFGTTEITKGSAFSWSGLTNGMNTKDLRVGAINSSLVEQRVGGAYKDTITVNITAGP